MIGDTYCAKCGYFYRDRCACAAREFPYEHERALMTNDRKRSPGDPPAINEAAISELAEARAEVTRLRAAQKSAETQINHSIERMAEVQERIKDAQATMETMRLAIQGKSRRIAHLEFLLHHHLRFMTDCIDSDALFYEVNGVKVSLKQKTIEALKPAPSPGEPT